MPAGRPSKLTDQLADQLCAHLRTGHYIETACALVGISKQSLYTWLKNGARLRDQGIALSKLGAHDRRCVEFLDAVERADAEALDRDMLRLTALGRGGLETTEVREVTTPEGKVKEKITITRQLAPNPQVLEWRMERRWPALFARPPARVEVSGPDGGPLELTTEERAEQLAADAELFLAGAAAAGQLERDTED